ncbi:hypothetical protein [Rheinheimera sp. MM224]|uniref:hypothetical protein n=1 Tax=Rheinheimera sp. MM224 TaxID=3019969 RepID=UPI0021F819CF|nr:hypothetical protein [Rheinheimera sp. MM224]CAI3795811.1 hypothetical protein JAMGFMIE_01411 [Rheinheimera sp. MM224]CAI3795972.1 hypothetical protein JAMGFMIE_01451 [Rheinheimera sp. MM224]
MKTMPHIHTPDDGRGRRKIFVNGNLIEKVFYADSQLGIVKFFPSPIRKHRNKDEAYSRKLKGKVTVEYLKDCHD